MSLLGVSLVSDAMGGCVCVSPRACLWSVVSRVGVSLVRDVVSGHVSGQ